MSKLSLNISITGISLYRDDGLLILRNKYGKETDRIKKDIIKTFNNTGFRLKLLPI